MKGVQIDDLVRAQLAHFAISLVLVPKLRVKPQERPSRRFRDAHHQDF
jgi:hypothetical protein